MCLIKKSWIPRIALHNKIVYKIVEGDGKQFRTPFMLDKIEIGKIYKAIGISLFDSLFRKQLKSGFIHSYYDYQVAKEVYYYFRIKEKSPNYKFEPYLIECIIPRFTFYYVGVFGDIASKKLKYYANL